MGASGQLRECLGGGNVSALRRESGLWVSPEGHDVGSGRCPLARWCPQEASAFLCSQAPTLPRSAHPLVAGWRPTPATVFCSRCGITSLNGGFEKSPAIGSRVELSRLSKNLKCPIPAHEVVLYRLDPALGRHVWCPGTSPGLGQRHSGCWSNEKGYLARPRLSAACGRLWCGARTWGQTPISSVSTWEPL